MKYCEANEETIKQHREAGIREKPLWKVITEEKPEE